MQNIRAKNICKSYGPEVKALVDASLDVRGGEFVSLLGPSGCGKSTLLRIIAGLEQMDGGELLRDDMDFSSLPVQERGIGMVFQNYALFPNMTVLRNVMFGLEMARMEKQEAKRVAKMWLDRVRLRGRENHYPHELSGGQQQRVALARALATNPRIFLLDEPLSALDASVRQELRDEIRRLQLDLGITTLYVTHDQGEALSMSDKVAVMKDGKMIEAASPREIYGKPQNLFTAEFVGSSTRLDGILLSTKPHYALFEDRFIMNLPPLKESAAIDDPVAIVIRSEDVVVNGGLGESIPGVVRLRSYLGGSVQYRAEIYPGKEMLVTIPLDRDVVHEEGDAIRLFIPESACHVFDIAGGSSLIERNAFGVTSPSRRNPMPVY